MVHQTLPPADAFMTLKQLRDIPDALANNSLTLPVIVVDPKNGKPVLVVTSYEQHQGLTATKE